MQTEGTVGNGRGRLARSRAITDVVVARLATDPLWFLHAPGSGCEECNQAHASVGRRTPAE